MSQLAWPERFAVTITPGTGGPGVTMEVCTWLHDFKAVALAVEEFGRRHPEQRVYDVSVERLGRAPRNEDGTVRATGLIDRYEW